jgi:uncharacterized protein YbjT (DUF2867 family)
MISAPTVTDALAGAQRPLPNPAVKAAGKTMLVAGASGRLGERILARALASPGYDRVYVIASDPMPSTEIKLTALTTAAWTSHIDHVIAVLGVENPGELSAARRRTEVFSPLAADQVLLLARHAKAMGVSRFMLVTPVDVLMQPAALRAQLGNLMEAELHRMGFESLLLVRPSDSELRQRQAGLAKRLMRLIVDLASGLLVGPRYTPLSVEHTARAAVRALQESGHGLTVLETDRLQLFANV